MTGAWDLYFAPAGAFSGYASCRRRCHGAYARQRENILHVFRSHAPRTVVALGAGPLNDLPYAEFVADGATVWLADWLPGSIDAGLRMSVVGGSAEAPECVCCTSSATRPEDLCRSFAGRPPGAGLCARFSPRLADGSIQCAAFERAERPFVLYEDITAGFASAFGRAWASEVARVTSWGDAFARGQRVARRVAAQRRPLSVPDAAAALVVSSMVLSQFEFEPYTFFSREVARRVGRPSVADEQRCASAMEALRTLLWETQVERHCEEIVRILAPTGRCYLSFEVFHDEAGAPGSPGPWYLVPSMARALEVIGRHFDFDFETLPESAALSRFSTGTNSSVVYCLVVVPIRDRPRT